MPMTGHRYQAFGLGIHSDRPLLDLPTADGPVDVVVRHGACAIRKPDTWNAGTCYHATPEAAYFCIESAGSFAALAQREIIVEPHGTAPTWLVGSIVLGLAMSAILHQRGYFVLHASVVSWENRAVALVGDKGWGKSTLAAALCARGFSLVTDDVAALQPDGAGRFVVQPGVPQVKLWPDASTAAGVDREYLREVDPRTKERLQIPTYAFVNQPVPVEQIYILSNRPKECVEPLSPREAFLELTRHTHSLVAQINKLTADEATRFDTRAAIAAAVPVFRLARPPELSAVARHAGMIQTSLATNRADGATS